MNYMKIFILVFSVSFNTMTFAGTTGENSYDLGFGFRLVMRDVVVNSPMGGIDHNNFLYFNEKELSKTSRYSISPSGKYAIYQDGKTGFIFLFDVSKNQSREFVTESLGILRTVEWIESEAIAKIIFNESGVVREMPITH